MLGHEKKKVEKVHSSAVPSREFQRILFMISQSYGLYPSFRISAPTKSFISEWGEITLPRIPKEDYLHPDEKYFLLIGVGYHSIAPRTEINRLLLRSIVSSIFRLDWKSPTVSWLSGFFSTLATYTQLSMNKRLHNHVKWALRWIIEVLIQNRIKSPLIEFALEYYRFLLKRKIDPAYQELVKCIYDTLSSNIPFEQKVKSFFTILKEFIKQELFDENKLRKNLSNITISLGSPIGEEKQKSWGENWRVKKDAKKKEISPEELSKLAKVDPKSALEIAKDLDKKLSEKAQQEIITKQKGGKLPGYSERLKMFQKLLSQRRYIAAVRKVRMEEIIAAFRQRPPGKKALAIRGQTTWEIGDEEEELNIEMSAETFGRVIPSLTTLRNLYEEDRDGIKPKSIGHIELIIDTSGSMNGLPIEVAIDTAIALTEAARRDENSIALVTFSSGAWEGIPPSFEYDAVEDIILRLLADGGTNLRGAIHIINEHLSQVQDLAAIFIISDTAIWDINKLEVREKIREWAIKMPVYLIAIADEMYEETEIALKNSFVRLIRIPPYKERPWEIVLDIYETL